jgi:hypothetical protein
MAQGGGRSIDGFITDQTGNPLRGVKIEAESDALIGKPRRTYTNAEGTFHIGGLNPGKYKVTANSPGLQTVIQENVPVEITSAAEVNLMMEVQTEQATVTVIEKAPTISTTKPNVKQSYDQKLVDAIPFRDTINQFRDVMHSAPGSINLRVRGGGVDQTLFLEDGFEIKDNFPPVRSAQAFEAQTAAYGADAPTASGGVSNMITRSGSNKFEFEFTAIHVGSWGEFFTDNLDSKSGLLRFGINPTVSGPIIKDKLWYHVNLDVTGLKQPNPRDPQLVLPPPAARYATYPKLVTKLSWQATARNRIDFLVNADTPYLQNQTTTAGVSDAAQEDRLAQRWFSGLTLETLLTEALLFRSQVGWLGYFQDVYPSNCRGGGKIGCRDAPRVTQTVPTTLQYGNSTRQFNQNKQSIQFVNSLEYFLSSKKAGEHKLRLRDFIFIERDKQQTEMTGGGFAYEVAGAVNTYRNEYFSNDPRLVTGQKGAWVATTEAFKHYITLSDQWKPTRRITANGSFSFVQATASNNAGTFPFSTFSWVPGLSVIWDVKGDGKNVLRTSGSVYVDIELSSIARFAIGTQVRNRCAWNATDQLYNSNCTYSGGASKNFVGDLKIPRTWEYTLGGSRELQKGLSFALDFVYRKFTNQYEDYENNKIWNESGTALLGYANGRAEDIVSLETLSSARRRYVGVTAQITKTEGSSRVEASYTWSRLDGTVLDGFTNYYGTNPSQDQYLYGPLDDDHRHEIKLTSSWDITPWLNTGVRYTYYSGTPRKRLFYNTVTGGYNLYRARPGMDPGADLNSPDDDLQIRMPDQQDLNVQIRLKLLPFIKHDAAVFMHILNVLAVRAPTSIGNKDSNDFGLVLERQEPFRIRVGVDYKW